MKACSKCRQEKDAGSFGRLAKAKDGLHSWCKPCLADWRREDRARCPERYSKIERDRHQRNGGARRERNRDWHANRTPETKARRRDAFMSRSERYNKNRRDQLEADPTVRTKRSEQNRAWRATNGDGVNAKRREKWRQATPTQKLRSYFGAAIAHALSGSGKGGRSWQQLVGYSTEDLRRHLERQFVPGMSWNNYGRGWHVDHVVPSSSFTYTSPDEPAFNACWCLSNLRPLWAIDNIRKRDNRTHLI